MPELEVQFIERIARARYEARLGSKPRISIDYPSPCRACHEYGPRYWVAWRNGVSIFHSFKRACEYAKSWHPTTARRKTLDDLARAEYEEGIYDRGSAANGM